MEILQYVTRSVSHFVVDIFLNSFPEWYDDHCRSVRFPSFPLPIGVSYCAYYLLYHCILLEGQIICLLHHRSYMKNYICVCWRRLSVPKRSWHLGSMQHVNERLRLTPLRSVECILGIERGMHMDICMSRIMESGKTNSWSTEFLVFYIKTGFS